MSRTYVQGRDLSSFDFGTRASPSMVDRICDKTIDMCRTGSIWWHDVWGDRYQPGIPVYRVEFEFARATLREFGLPRRPRSWRPVPIFGPTPRNNGSPTRDLASSPPDRLGRMVTLEVHNTEQRLCPGPANRTTVNVALGKG
jgi:hypothetical protein